MHTALEIREAVIAGDTATLNRKVEWEALRASLKSSITPETISRLMTDPDAPKPSLWQRIKAAVAPSMADSVIERYVTPEHLPVLLGYRQCIAARCGRRWASRSRRRRWRARGSAARPFDSFASFWTRVRRAVFMSPTRFVLEVEDKYRPGRHFIGTLELKSYEWKLTGLSVTGSDGL